MPDKLDAPYYITTLDNRSIHVCGQPGHVSYWLNATMKVWTCDRCHPHTGDRVVRPVGELVRVEGVNGESTVG